MKAVSITVCVQPKSIAVTISTGEKSASSIMVKDGPGSWKGTQKASLTEKAIASVVEDHDCDNDEISDIVDDMMSRGIDLHDAMMMGED